MLCSCFSQSGSCLHWLRYFWIRGTYTSVVSRMSAAAGLHRAQCNGLYSGLSEYMRPAISESVCNERVRLLRNDFFGWKYTCCTIYVQINLIELFFFSQKVSCPSFLLLKWIWMLFHAWTQHKGSQGAVDNWIIVTPSGWSQYNSRAVWIYCIVQFGLVNIDIDTHTPTFRARGENMFFL